MSITHLKMDTPPLFMSKDLKEVAGRAKAVHKKALAMDLWVTTRWLLPGASSISVLHGTLHCLL